MQSRYKWNARKTVSVLLTVIMHSAYKRESEGLCKQQNKSKQSGNVV
jgi:hypothetical protein